MNGPTPRTQTVTVALPDNEGTLSFSLQTEKLLQPAQVDDKLIEGPGVSAVHCQGIIVIASVSPEKKVLHCQHCGLRISVPLATRTFRNLRHELHRQAGGKLEF